MDTSIMFELFLSVIIFAPGAVLLTAAMFVGVLILLEKTGVLGDNTRENTDDSDLEFRDRTGTVVSNEGERENSIPERVGSTPDESKTTEEGL
tara:strand:- start:32220 stop:32498 length:279 start_codon:yes stop_codon:yes gene_type:complete